MAKRRKLCKIQFKEDNNKIEDEKQLEVKALEPQREETAQAQSTADPLQADSGAPQPSVTSTQSTKTRTSGAVRSVCAMHKVVKKKAQGKKFKVLYNRDGIPIGDTRHALQSYIGMLARNMVPIHIPSWPEVDPELKQNLWSDVQDTFKVAPESQKLILQSAGAKWRQFKATLTANHVIPYLGQKKKLMRPPQQYAFVGRKNWRKFVAARTTDEWMSLNKEQSNRVGQRKYPHRVSRKGYIGLQEEEISSGRLKPDEVLDRAILWKKARKPKEGDEHKIDKELAKINDKIDSLLEKQRNGEFQPIGSTDVLTTALETPEHPGRVRGVGSFIPPTLFFNMPKDRRTRITKSELLARDQKREDDFERKTKIFEAQIAELKSLINASNFHSPMLSDKASKASCREEKEELNEEIKFKNKPVFAKELMVDEDNDADFVAIDHVNPPPPEKKGPHKCELAVDNIDNKVAFGVVFDEEDDMGKSVHSVPLKSGYLRVSVDGSIKADALVPVPIAGEIETVQQAVGSYLAWPREMIIFTPTPSVEKKRKLSNKDDLQRMQSLFNTVKPKENLPNRFKVLYKHATTLMKESGDSIQIPCDVEVFGIERSIFLLHENIISLVEFQMIGQAVISTYMAYLHTTVVRKDDLFAFLDPSIYKLNDDFEAYVVKMLKDRVLRVNFMPYNYNVHWILIIIWESEIFILNPLSRQTHPPELEEALMRAVRSYNAQTGRVNRNPKVKYLLGCPKQPGGHECGYVVMRYMKDLIEDKEMKLLNKWATKSRKTYTRDELDVVRFETLDYIQEIM